MTTTTNTIEFKTNPAACCDDEGTRFALHHVLVMPNGQACATDGRILSVTQGNTPEDKPLAKPIYLARHIPSKPCKLTLSDDGKHVERETGIHKRKTELFEQPEFEGWFPRVDECIQPLNGECYSLTLDAKFVARMADAIAAQGKDEAPSLTLFITLPDKGKAIDKPISVLGEHGVGVIMPMLQEHKDKLADFNDTAKRFAAQFTNK